LYLPEFGSLRPCTFLIQDGEKYKRANSDSRPKGHMLSHTVLFFPTPTKILIAACRQADRLFATLSELSWGLQEGIIDLIGGVETLSNITLYSCRCYYNPSTNLKPIKYLGDAFEGITETSQHCTE